MSYYRDYEDRNYYSDHRVRAGSSAKWYKSLDQKRMIAEVDSTDEDGNEELIEVPFTWEVCPTCQGKGKHTNPSIDASGISSEEFHDDPDFEESYLRGDYDVNCYNCGGIRVVAVTNDEVVLEAEREQREYERIRDAERRMGC